VLEGSRGGKPRYLASLREYLDALAGIGELVRVEREVDWNLEIGAIIRRCYETGAPAALFQRIKGIEPGFRVLGAPAGVSRQKDRYFARVALSLGLDASAGGREIVEALVSARQRPGIKPRRIATGPCKENILTGEAANLLRLPVPLIHDGDGGRYINTWGTVVARAPDGSWTNWGVARVMRSTAAG